MTEATNASTSCCWKTARSTRTCWRAIWPDPVMQFDLRRATGRQSFMDAIEADGFEIILADYSLPDFDGLTALHIAKARYPDVPFIFVSGVVGEEFATDALKQGATDYVLKRNLMRLPAAVDRALAEARERRDRRRAEAALLESDVRLRLAVVVGRSLAPGITRRTATRWSGGPVAAATHRTAHDTTKTFMAGSIRWTGRAWNRRCAPR